MASNWENSTNHSGWVFKFFLCRDPVFTMLHNALLGDIQSTRVHSFSILSEQFVWGYKSWYVERVCCSKTKHVELYQLSFEYGSKQIWLLKTGKQPRRFKSCTDITTVGPYWSDNSEIWLDNIRLSFPALLQDGTFIGIYTLKWPTFFHKGQFFFSKCHLLA